MCKIKCNCHENCKLNGIFTLLLGIGTLAALASGVNAAHAREKSAALPAGVVLAILFSVNAFVHFVQCFNNNCCCKHGYDCVRHAPDAPPRPATAPATST